MNTLTPLAFYLEAKKHEPETVWLVEVGDYYETFDDDARLLAKACDLAITTTTSPMVGFPYHALGGNLRTLLVDGHRCGIVVHTPGQRADEVTP